MKIIQGVLAAILLPILLFWVESYSYAFGTYLDNDICALKKELNDCSIENGCSEKKECHSIVSVIDDFNYGFAIALKYKNGDGHRVIESSPKRFDSPKMIEGVFCSETNKKRVCERKVNKITNGTAVFWFNAEATKGKSLEFDWYFDTELVSSFKLPKKGMIKTDRYRGKATKIIYNEPRNIYVIVREGGSNIILSAHMLSSVN